NVNILSIFIFVPLLGIPLKAARYLDYLEIVYNFYINSTRKLYAITNLMTYGLSVLMNLSAITLVHQFVNTHNFKEFSSLKYRALAQGYPLAIFWSPYYISMALLLSYFNVSWLELFPVGFVIAGVGFILGILLESNKKSVEIYSSTDIYKKEIKQAWKKTVELIVIIILLTIIIMAMEQIINISVIPTISFLSIILSIIWTICYQPIRYLLKELKQFTQTNWARMGNELVLFISAGVFGQAIINIGAGDLIIYFLNITGINHPLVLIFLIMILTCFLALIGFHPIITITVLAVTFSSSPYFEEFHRILAMGMLVSWALSIPISPFSGLTLLLTGLTRENVLKGIKTNLVFVVILLFLSFAILSFLHLFFRY